MFSRKLIKFCWLLYSETILWLKIIIHIESFKFLWKFFLIINFWKFLYLTTKKNLQFLANHRSTEVQILMMLNRMHHKNIIQPLYKFSQSYPDQKVSHISRFKVLTPWTIAFLLQNSLAILTSNDLFLVFFPIKWK